MTQISQMDRIYSQAIVTIAAVSGNSAQDPLPGVQRSSRQPPSFVQECAEASFCSQPPALTDFMQLTTYQSRAWTLQEKLLSKRCLYFTNRQIYFECPQHMVSEVGESNISSSWSSSSDSNQRGTNPLTVLRHNLAKPSILEPEDENPELSWVPSFAAYRALVVEYSRRRMTNPSDSLNAFAGISSVLQKLSGSPFVCGIPESYIDLALLWVPKAPLERRLDGPQGTIPFTTSTNPTWSWAGWIGAIDFLVLYEGGGELFIPEMQELAFKTEICIVGIQHGSELLRIARSKKFENPYDGLAPPRLLSPSLPVDVLHIVAEVISAKEFWKEGGKFLTSDATHTIFEPKQPALKLWNSKMGGMWNLKHDMTSGPAANHFKGMGQYNYREFGMRDAGLKKVHDGDSLQFILLSRCKRFPPNSSAIVDTAALVMEFEREDNPDAVQIDFESGRGKPWAIMNVMLVKWKGTAVEADGYAERVMVGHVHEDSWAKCGPRTGYLKLA